MRTSILTVALAAACLAAGPAHGTDFLKNSGAAPIDWAGVYAGINGGYGYSRGDASAATSTRTTFTCCGGFAYPASGTSAAGAFNADGDGALFGGTLGYNYQVGQFVVGVEGDIDWSGIEGNGSQNFATTPVFAVPIGPGIGIGYPTNVAVRSEMSIPWLATIRGRVGMQVFDASTLVFITGGAAVGEVKGSTTVTVTSPGLVTPGIVPSASGSATASFDQTNWGWVLGGGIERRFAGPWSVKIEYLHIDLGDVGAGAAANARALIAGGIGCPGFCPAVNSSGNGSASRSITADIFRVGLNYRFWQ